MNCIYSHEGGAYCDKHDHGAVTVGCCGEESCPDRKVLTNADRIRQMTDEELAEWLEYRDDNCPRAGCYKGGCHECWLDWLKSPVEEVDNG